MSCVLSGKGCVLSGKVCVLRGKCGRIPAKKKNCWRIRKIDVSQISNDKKRRDIKETICSCSQNAYGKLNERKIRGKKMDKEKQHILLSGF